MERGNKTRAVKKLPFSLDNNRLFHLRRVLLNIFFPNRCPVCRSIIGAEDRFCENCDGKLKRYSGSFNIRGASASAAALEYDRTSSRAVYLMKNGVCGNAAYALGGELADKLKSSGIADKTDILIPIPMHSSDIRRRGYNQAELIAKEVGRIIGKPCVCNNAVKIRKTEQQKKLSRTERRSNLRDSFDIRDSSVLRGKNILLIDDVCTTGSTMEELTRLIKHSGANEVYCAACCKTPSYSLKAQK